MTYQLATCCDEGGIEAMVVANGDGVPLASAGDDFACDYVAARMVRVGPRIRDFHGTLLGEGAHWDCQMRKLDLGDAGEVVVCAIGGTAAERQRQIQRSLDGAARILRAA
ncbi:MAG TPA: hypothetical protein VL463_12080 [Kofleriaceae bacterium]|nr:hypothetical protein [Kofleriaceae bacterium]